MWIADKWQDYELLDCGGGEKLERWDKQLLVRPDPQAIWESPRRNPAWRKADGRYLRSQTGGGQLCLEGIYAHVRLLGMAGGRAGQGLPSPARRWAAVCADQASSAGSGPNASS